MIKLIDFIDFNPRETLGKGTLARKISMVQLQPFTRQVNSSDFEIFSGGSKFRNGDTLLARITPCLENGKTSFVSTLDNNEVAFGSTEFIVARAKPRVSLPLFVYYLLCSKPIRDVAILSMTGSSGRERVQQFMLDNYEIPEYSLACQQHIVDTIGSVDDLIENIDQKLLKIKDYGGLLFEKNITNNIYPLLNIVNFEKGKEIGALNYLDKQENGTVPYIRVGNLLNCEYDSYVFNIDCPKCNVDDILIAFDGAPGRNCIGLYGCYSSGIQKVVCDKKIKGYIYFYLNSNMCQNIIRTYSQGTTILHAGKAIKELMLPTLIDEECINILNFLYNEMISLIKKKYVLKSEKSILLKKYFE